MKLSSQVCRCLCRGMQFSLRMKRRMCPWCAYNSQYVKREDERERVFHLYSSFFLLLYVLLCDWESLEVQKSCVWISPKFDKKLEESYYCWVRCSANVYCLQTELLTYFLDSNLKIVFKMFVIFFLYWISQFTCSHVLKKTEDGDFNCLFAIWWTSQLAYFCNFYFYFIFSRCTELL